MLFVCSLRSCAHFTRFSSSSKCTTCFVASKAKMVNIKLKWNKETFDNVEVDLSQGVSALKDTIYKLTSVPKDRQKLMAKGAWTGTLKDETDLSTTQLKEGHQVMLMGSAEVVAAPKESIKFVEDMTLEEQALKGAIIPAGLVNLGNTCYMNATVECFRYMPEVREALASSHSINLATLLKSTFNELDRSGISIPPYSFVHNLRTNHPQFAETTNQGRFMQQDAEEFYNTLTAAIQREVDRTPNPFNSLLGVELEERLTCQETDQEAAIVRKENVNKLVCNIQGGGGSVVTIDHMLDGLKLGLDGTIEKHSAVLGRNALWSKKQRVSSLPRYLCFQFMRFFWKPTPDSRDHTGVKCKILRAVTFPESFDVYELCNEELQRKLRINRQEADKAFESDLAQKRAKVSADATPGTSSAAAVAPPAPPAVPAGLEAFMAEGMDEEEARALAEALRMSMGDNGDTESEMKVDAPEVPPPAPAPVAVEKEVSTGPIALGNGLPVGFTGQYELHAVVTHKGRSADSGHYIGWVRQSPGSPLWWCYNDDVVTEVRTEDIMKLGGGGDRDMAYINFYRFRDNKK